MQPALEALAELEGEFPELAQNARYSLKTVGAKYAARLVRDMRRAAGLTQGQLASHLGQTQPMISDIERARGQFGPVYGQLAAIADACGMEITFKRKGAAHESSGSANRHEEERC
jgi:transcriptional regulator with XRE-family HTH domain